MISLTTNNKTVNITAKSDIPKDILWDGKLLFILPNSTVINATYAANGTWWALHKFDNAGDYNINASYIGLDNVTINNATISIRYDTSVDVNNKTLDLSVDDKFTIVATTVPEGLNVTYVPDDSGVYSIDENGNVIALKEGKGSILVKVGGDGIYAENSTTVNVTVSKVPTEITVDTASLDLFVGDETVIVATLTPADAGNVTYTSSDDSIVTVNADGKVFAVSEGNATVTVSYAGDDKYNPIETKVTVTVKKDTSDIIIAPDVTKYYKGSEKFVVTVTDHKGNPLADKTVEININGKTYTRTTDANGTASMAIGLPSNTYNVTVTVDNQTVNSAITVLSTVNGTDVIKMYRNDTQYYATFLDSEGKYLKNGTTVKFNINGIMYERKISGDKGLAKLNINLPAGEYIITAINPVNGEMEANNITVLSTITENKDITKYYKNATQYTVKVLGADGKAVGAGQTVKFNINGVFYERKTDESGTAKLSINLPAGDYVITAEYNGCKVANNITVLPVLSAKDITMKYHDGTQFTATLVNGQGKPYAEQKVQFNINGVLYKKETDSKGQAKLNINLLAGEYIITSSYNGFNIANKITIRG